MQMRYRGSKKERIVLVGIGLLVGSALVAAATLKPWQNETLKGSVLPTSATSQIKSFKPYFYEQSIPHGFSLDQKSVSYEDGVLFATLRDDKNRTIALTQQELPENLASQSREKFDKVGGAYGEAYITYQGTKMVGGLFAKPNAQGKRTLVLLVANEPIERSAMEDLLRSLRPNN